MAVKLTLMIDGDFTDIKQVIDILASEGHFITLQDIVEKNRDIGLTNRILDALRDNPMGLTTGEVGEIVGRPSNRVSPILLGFLKGSVKRVDRIREWNPHHTAKVWKWYYVEPDPDIETEDEGSTAARVQKGYERQKRRRKQP